MADVYELFKEGKSVTLRTEDMTVDKVSRIFKVSYATGTNVKPWCGANG